MDKERIISADAKTLIILMSLRNIMGMFLGSFFVAHIMQIAENETVSLSVYNLAFSLCLTVGFFLAGGYVKNGGRMLVYRLSSLLMIAFLLGIVFFKSALADYMFACGCVYGLSVAFQGYPWNVLVSEKVAPETMPGFNGYKETSIGICRIVVPFLLGLFITGESYEKMAGAMCFVAAAEFLMTFRIRTTPGKKGKIRLWDYLRSVKDNRFIRKIYLVEFLRGLTFFGVFSTIFAMYIVYIFHTPLNMGIISSSFAVIGIALSFVFGRYAVPSHFSGILNAANIFFIAASVVFIWQPGEKTLLLYNLAVATALKLVETITDCNCFNAPNRKGMGRQYREEFFMAREIVLDAGRALGFLILLGIGISGQAFLLKYFLFVLTLCIVWLGFVSVNLSRES